MSVGLTVRTPGCLWKLLLQNVIWVIFIFVIIVLVHWWSEIWWRDTLSTAFFVHVVQHPETNHQTLCLRSEV